MGFFFFFLKSCGSQTTCLVNSAQKLPIWDLLLWSVKGEEVEGCVSLCPGSKGSGRPSFLRTRSVMDPPETTEDVETIVLSSRSVEFH